eukprot:TRINITY_DN1143_c0_g1_i3.p1 TRINITY_DN1143_c0_g1~~TRINITY_DN1143_c0_g1_i3.p1  ORF type:complete len:189 (+),score=29.10 TRINITY_DN1143_c0_g1_i3:13-579(+)
MTRSIVVESRRKSLANLQKAWPEATLIDVTSKGPEPWVRFSPFWPHGGIPIPNSAGLEAQSVEGLWQGLKAFEQADVDPAKWAITNMKSIKRSARSLGPVRGHRFGVESEELLSYRDARLKIYLPAYRWILDNHLGSELAALRRLPGTLVLLDYETNSDVNDLSKPLSHASLVKYYLEGTWPDAGSEG